MSYLSDKLLVTGYLMLLLSGTVNATDKTATTEASVDSDWRPFWMYIKAPAVAAAKSGLTMPNMPALKLPHTTLIASAKLKPSTGYCRSISLVTPAFLKTVLYLKAIYRRVLFNGF